MTRGPKDHFFSTRIKSTIKHIPFGKVATYGQIASLVGNHRASRQVAWVLHSSSHKDGLPWHRVINRRGEIALEPGEGFEEQKRMLENEGIQFDSTGRINLGLYMWDPGNLIL